MTDIVNFVPLAATVTVRGQSFKLRGLEFEEVGQLVYRFPEIRNMLDGGKFNAAGLVGLPAVVAAVIAVATDRGGDEKSEKAFANLALGERATFLSKIVELTAPDGIAPFVDLVRAVMPEGFQAPTPEVDVGKLKTRVRPSSKSPAV